MAEIANLNTKLSLESASFISGVEKSRGALRSLISSLDPVAAASAKYNRQVQLLEGGLKRGTLTAEQHAVALQRLNQRYQDQVRNQGAVTGSTGMMRSGMQQLSFQLGDVATQFASGTRPMVIFAQQGGQVIQAIQMMTSSSKGFLGFLGGPWGQIITAAVVVLTSLSSKLFDNADAANAAADGVDNYTEALNALHEQAGAFSFGSAEFGKVQKDLLEAEARVGRLRQELAGAPSDRPTTITPGGTAINQQVRSRSVIQRELEAASGVRDSLRGDLNVLLTQRRNREIADRRDPRPERQRRGPRDRTDQIEERFDDQMARLKQEQLTLQLAITSDIRYRANILDLQVQAELEAYKADLEHQVAQKEITAERAKELLAVKERNAELQIIRINRDLDAKITQEEIALARSSLELQQAARDGELDAARTQADRRRIQLQMLDAETEILRQEIQRQLLSKDLTDTDRQLLQDKLSMIGIDAANRRAGIERGTMGPMARYLDSLPRTAAEMNEAFEAVRAGGLQSVIDGLADAAVGARSLGDVFSSVSRQIVADLIRIQIQKMVVSGLSNALNGLGGVFGGAGNPSAGFDIGKTVSSVKTAKFAGGGAFTVLGMPGVDRNRLSINGMPVADVSYGERVTVSPTNDNGRSGGPYFDLRGAVMTEDLLAQMNALAEGAAVRGATGGAALAQRQLARSSRRRLG